MLPVVGKSAMSPSACRTSKGSAVPKSTPRRRVERAMSLRNGKPLDQYAEQRSCAAPGCTVNLSRYNPQPTCATHGGWNASKQVRRRPGRAAGVR